MTVRVAAGARLHVGFGNLSLARERLYGGVGVAIEEPAVVVTAEPTGAVRAPDHIAPVARRAVEVLGVAGADVGVKERLPRHVGLGSGTQRALATLAAVAYAHDCDPDIRALAPDLGRGGRSGVGVAAFECGGFVTDAGHPTERFTTEPPPPGEWTVPPVTARHELPGHWRFVVALPDVEPGRSGEDEDESMRAVVEAADPTVADELARVLVQRLLPAAAAADLGAFGSAVTEFGRLNGAWYADEQGGVYRPPAGEIVDALVGEQAVEGVGQSSWGPAVYALTDAGRADEVEAAAADAVEAAGGGEVVVTRPRNAGASVEVIER